MDNGILFIISAPSGAGKTSLVKALLSQVEGLEKSVSHTTRPRRLQETSEKDYIFVDEPTFLQYQDEEVFLECAQVFKYWYGTSKTWVENKLQKGTDVILEIDWQGARFIKAKMPCVTIFLLPPSKADLKARLTARKQDDETVIAYRMQQAHEELSHFNEYDYLVINDDFEQALKDLTVIIQANRLTYERQSLAHQKLIKDLLT